MSNLQEGWVENPVGAAATAAHDTEYEPHGVTKPAAPTTAAAHQIKDRPEQGY